MVEISICGIKLRLSVIFFAAAAVWLTTDTGHAAVLCLLASILHEAGHLSVLFYFRRKPESLTLGLFGIKLLHPTDHPLPVGIQIGMLLAGPAANLFTSIPFGLYGGWDGMFVRVNIAIGLFNLLPIAPLDGGQALCEILRLRFPAAAPRFSIFLSCLFLVPLATCGFWLLLTSGWNFSLLAVCLYLSVLLITH